jgi:regulation of enolase protein 1 (concanavalin A-like superfamily)
VKLTRSGTTFRAYRSSDGAAWTLVGSDTIEMTATISVGLAVTSHRDGTLATATFADVDVDVDDSGGDPEPSLPAGWSSGDVGAVGVAGAATHTDGTFTLRGSGADVWGTADAFRFAYRQLTGDGSIVARVAAVEDVDAWTKAGVMMRDGSAAGAAHAFMLVSPGKGLAFQRRLEPGGTSAHTSGGSGTAPVWVRLTRSGDTFSAYRSSDGVSWTPVGSESISMGPTVSVGLAVTSHRDGALATATFTDVSITAGL